MASKPMNRRVFSKMVAGTFFTGSLVEAAVQETRQNGALSDDTALTLLDHLGYKPSLPDEMKTLKPMLESAMRDIQRVRDFQLPISLEPAFVFHPDK